MDIWIFSSYWKWAVRYQNLNTRRKVEEKEEKRTPLPNALPTGAIIWSSGICACLRGKHQGSGAPWFPADGPLQGPDVARAAWAWKTSVLTPQAKPKRFLPGVKKQTEARVNWPKLMIIEVSKRKLISDLVLCLFKAKISKLACKYG